MTGPVAGAKGDARRRREWESSVNARLARLERAMYTLIGVGTATAGTAMWNLFANISQGGP